MAVLNFQFFLKAKITKNNRLFVIVKYEVFLEEFDIFFIVIINNNKITLARYMEDAENFIDQNLNLSVPSPPHLSEHVILLLSLNGSLKSLYGKDLAKNKSLVCVCFSCFQHLCSDELIARFRHSTCGDKEIIRNLLQNNIHNIHNNFQPTNLYQIPLYENTITILKIFISKYLFIGTICDL